MARLCPRDPKGPGSTPSPAGDSKPYLVELEIPVVYDGAHGHLVPLRERHWGQHVSPVIDELVDLRRTGPRHALVDPQPPGGRVWNWGVQAPNGTHGFQALWPASLAGRRTAQGCGSQQGSRHCPDRLPPTFPREAPFPGAQRETNKIDAPPHGQEVGVSLHQLLWGVRPGHS